MLPEIFNYENSCAYIQQKIKCIVYHIGKELICKHNHFVKISNYNYMPSEVKNAVNAIYLL